MGTRLPNSRGTNLYEFWGERITNATNAQLTALGNKHLVNLASNEYFKSIQPKHVAGQIITPQFKERKGDEYKMIGIHAKRARGLMSRFILRNKLEDPEQIKSFSEEGYSFSNASSRVICPVKIKLEN